MLTIRTAQLEAFETVALRAFEDRTYAHLYRYFPRHCALLGEAQMRQVIRYGLQKSESYDFTAECCVRSYIEFMCLLGGGFDADPLLPWAREILTDKTDPNQVARGDRLYDRVWEYIDHIVPDYRDAAGSPLTARFVVELRRLREESDAVVTQDSWPSFSRRLHDRLRNVFPAKCGYVGSAAVTDLVVASRNGAGHYGIAGERGITVFATLELVLGSGFDRDLLLPWASAVLNDTSLSGETKKTDRLFAEAIGFLRRWWDPDSGQEA